MTKCCILMCGAIRNKNQPQLTLHRFPKSEVLRKKWLNAIGEKNINLRQKIWFVCSLHFEESCFNRSLDILRLRDDALPTIFPFPLSSSSRQDTSVLHATSNIMPDVSSTSAAAVLCQSPVPDLIQKSSSRQDTSVLHVTSNIMSDVSSPSPAAVLCQSPVPDLIQKDEKTEEIQALKEKCMKQQKKIKSLNVKIKRKEKKIADMEDIIKDLCRKNQINSEQAVMMEDLAGSQGFLKRQIMKSKGLPLPNKYPEDIRKFAVTLHRLSPKAYNYVRQTYITCLPHMRTLCKWYQDVNAEPDDTEEAFDTLKNSTKERMSSYMLLSI